MAVEARVVVDGADATLEADPEQGTLRVSNADALLLVLTIATDYNTPDPAEWCRKHLDSAAAGL